jgi:hypothetical protein
VPYIGFYASWAEGTYNEQRYISKLWFGQKFFNWAFEYIFLHLFFNRQRFSTLVRADTNQQATGKFVDCFVKGLCFPVRADTNQSSRSLTYGSNYGKWEKLPSQNYSVYLTDMNDHKKLLPYENYGIVPNKILSENADWVEQTIEIIRRK